MRARSLKPAIFKNELLAVADPSYMVTFIGLWCAADREGRLEDRPARLHFEINPGRAYAVTEQALAWLEQNGFIQRYQVDGGAYISIPAFVKHQTPHQNEKPSALPEPPLATKDASAFNQGGKHFALTPDSGLLTPDCGQLTPDSPTTETAVSDRGKPRTTDKSAKRLPDDFELTKERRAVAEAERLPADRTFDKFVDYWRSASGARARKMDWDATWRNWCRTEADRARSTPAGAAGPPPKRPPPSEEELAAARREAAEKNRREMERLNRPQLEAAEKRDVAGLIRATAAGLRVTGGR